MRVNTVFKQSLIGLTSAIILLTALPARAQKFEEILPALLTPAESEVYSQVGNAQATQLASDTCKSLDSGVSIRDYATKVAQSISSQGVPQEQLEARASYSGKVIAAAVVTMCPQHMQQLQDLQP
jgi:hypothetical protein